MINKHQSPNKVQSYLGDPLFLFSVDVWVVHAHSFSEVQKTLAYGKRQRAVHKNVCFEFIQLCSTITKGSLNFATKTLLE